MSMPRPIRRALIALTLLATGCTKTPDAQKLHLGINLGSISYFGSEIVFVDVFKQAHAWISQAPGQPFDRGGPLELDARGWVKKLNGDGHFAETLMFVDIQGHYPGGNYVCLYDGDGEIEFARAATVIERQPGRLVVKVTPSNEPIALRLLKTDPGNPARNIRLLLPGFENTYREEPFHPDFLKRWAGFEVIRFMGWAMTNDSPVVKWSDRSTPDDAMQATAAGIALEYQIQLANALNADPWFCVPHLADDDYVRDMAQLVKARLNPDRKIYLEFSNECWHPGFAGGKHCAEWGRTLHLSKNDYEAELRYYSQRSVEIFKLFGKELGSNDRLVRVISTQHDSEWAFKTVLDWKDAGQNVDALATAPYFGGDFGKPSEAMNTLSMGLEQLLGACEIEIAARSKRMKSFAAAVRGRGLQLLAYEGGQHLVGSEGTQDNEQLTQMFQAANRHPRMKALYRGDLRGWEEAGGGLFCVFQSTARFSKWGSWGVLEYADQDEATAPKLQAIRERQRPP